MRTDKNESEMAARINIAAERSSPVHRKKSEAASWPKHLLQITFRIWPDRWRQRQALREMDDDQLRDLGIDKDAARREAAKPFWR